MILFEHTEQGCMRLGTIPNNRSQGHRKVNVFQLPVAKRTSGDFRKIFTKNQIRELLFESCVDCEKMAAIPQGAFAACKVRANRARTVLISLDEEKEKRGKENAYNCRPPVEGWELTPLKYNSKLMNSIWGLYNRYSVHNFKKNTDSNEGVSQSFATVCNCVLESCAPVATGVAAPAATLNTSIVIKGNSI